MLLRFSRSRCGEPGSVQSTTHRNVAYQDVQGLATLQKAVPDKNSRHDNRSCTDLRNSEVGTRFSRSLGNDPFHVFFEALFSRRLRGSVCSIT